MENPIVYPDPVLAAAEYWVIVTVMPNLALRFGPYTKDDAFHRATILLQDMKHLGISMVANCGQFIPMELLMDLDKAATPEVEV
jgi:hypothetical protein